MPGKNVLVVGGGVAGLSAALFLVRLGIRVDLVEREPDLGGHAGQLTCKATHACVQCGACVVENKRRQVACHPEITVYSGSRVKDVQISERFSMTLSDRTGSEHACEADAVILASGFSPCKPEDRPYGYGRFENVITSLELETMVREKNAVTRPSDLVPPGSIAFIQCVGSRDEKHNHLWCSRICCESALRMARLIRFRQPDTEISLFYVDIQSTGKGSRGFLEMAQNEIRMMRVIPADIFGTDDDRLRITYFTAGEEGASEQVFDLVVLSVGIAPEEKLQDLAALFHVRLSDTGFIATAGDSAQTSQAGIFAAGAVLGPMNIADSVASAGSAVLETATYLKQC